MSAPHGGREPRRQRGQGQQKGRQAQPGQRPQQPGKSSDIDDALIPPLHLVLVEEPEAHLHAQVQQVFITQAYGVLRKHDKLKESKDRGQTTCEQ